VGVYAAVFIYALLAMLVARAVLIPEFLSSTDGIIHGDPLYYQSIALAKTAEMKAYGLTRFELRPQGQGPAGVASLLYLLWQSPFVVLLLNAALHAGAACCLLACLRQWFSRRTAVFSILPFVLSPYMIVWFSQLNKDSFATAGVLMFISGFSGMTLAESKGKYAVGHFMLAIGGVLLVWIVRPYLNQVLLPAALISALVFAACRWTRASFQWRAPRLFFPVAVSVLLLAMSALGVGAASDETLTRFSGFSAADYKDVIPAGTAADACIHKLGDAVWLREERLPDYVNEKLKAMMGQRCFVFTILYSDSNPTTLRAIVDADVLPGGTAEAIAYIPRALQLGVFLPSPGEWMTVLSEQRSFFYGVVPAEALLLYAGMCALLIWLWLTGNWLVLIPVFAAVLAMTVYGMSTPFMGALYRYRYPFWMLLVCLGLASICDLSVRACSWRRNRRGR
jgi:hypothetical protein